MFRNNNCIECGSVLITTRYETLCSNCGLVHYEDRFQEISEKHNNLQNDRKNHSSLGKQITYAAEQGSDIGHFASKVLYDIKNQPLGPELQKKFKRLIRYYNLPLKTKYNETEARILTILSKVADYLELKKSIVENAAFYYKKILKNETKVKNNVSLIALCIFMSIRSESLKAPVGIKEISAIFNDLGHHITPRLIMRSGIKYKKYFTIKIKSNKPERYIPKLIELLISNPSFLEKFSLESTFDLEKYRIILSQTTDMIICKLPERLYSGRNPIILASAIIYAADRLISKNYGSRILLTQKIVSDSTKVAEYSVRDHFVKILKPFFFHRH